MSNCPKCQGDMLNAKVRESKFDSKVKLTKRGFTIPELPALSGLEVTAHVCSGCGYIEFYVAKPEEVVEKLG